MTTTVTDPAPTDPNPVDPTPTDPTPPLPTDPTPTDPAADTAAELAKWKDLARQHEKRSKANAKAADELEALKAQSLTEQEKAVKAAVDTAKADARKEVLTEVGAKLAEAAIRVAAAGRNVDVDALLEAIDPSRFLDDDGDPDTKAIAAWIDRVAPVQSGSDDGKPKRDLGQGARGGQPPALNSSQLEKDLKSVLGVT